jgi:hypothetical protein
VLSCRKWSGRQRRPRPGGNAEARRRELLPALRVVCVFPLNAGIMSAKHREVAETVFDKRKRREAEIENALRQELARHEAAIKNMHRLRSLRLQRDAQTAKPH